VKYWLEIGTFVFSGLAAVLWLISARVLIPGGYPLGMKLKQIDDVSKAATRQSKWSARAAISAAVAAACQAVAWLLT
jgi:hypothetical protein